MLYRELVRSPAPYSNIPNKERAEEFQSYPLDLPVCWRPGVAFWGGGLGCAFWVGLVVWARRLSSFILGVLKGGGGGVDCSVFFRTTEREIGMVSFSRLLKLLRENVSLKRHLIRTDHGLLYHD